MIWLILIVYHNSIKCILSIHSRWMESVCRLYHRGHDVPGITRSTASPDVNERLFMQEHKWTSCDRSKPAEDSSSSIPFKLVLMGFSRKETKSAPVVMTLTLSVGSMNRVIYSRTTAMKEGRKEGNLYFGKYIYTR